MDLTSISNAVTAGRLASAKLSAGNTGGTGSTNQTSTQDSNDRIAKAFEKVEKRTQALRNTTSVELSAFGKLQSSVAETQNASRALSVLSDAKQTTTEADVKKAASRFVTAFNNAASAARSTVDSQDKGANPASAASSSARRADSDLRKTINVDATTKSDLKSIGITQQKDGSLVFDSKKFDAALKADPTATRSTLSKIGQEVDRTATKELAKTGNIGGTVASLTNRARELERLQTSQQTQASAALQAVTTQATRFNNSLNTATEAYQRIFSL